LHFSDNDQIVQQVAGHWDISPAYLCWIRALRWSNHVLRDVLRVKPWMREHVQLDLLRHTRRECNVAADFVANFVLDREEDVHVSGSLPIDVKFNLNLVLWSDGASRGNPGKASAAAVLCVVHSESDLSVSAVHDAFFTNNPNANLKCSIVAVKGVFLGVATSVQAEAEAACLGRRLLVDWLIESQVLV
jgi:ribonuclease HI